MKRAWLGLCCLLLPLAGLCGWLPAPQWPEEEEAGYWIEASGRVTVFTKTKERHSQWFPSSAGRD